MNLHLEHVRFDNSVGLQVDLAIGARDEFACR